MEHEAQIRLTVRRRTKSSPTAAIAGALAGFGLLASADWGFAQAISSGALRQPSPAVSTAGAAALTKQGTIVENAAARSAQITPQPVFNPVAVTAVVAKPVAPTVVAPKIETRVLVNPAPVAAVVAPIAPKPQPVITTVSPSVIVTKPVTPAAVAPKIETQVFVNPAPAIVVPVAPKPQPINPVSPPAIVTLPVTPAAPKIETQVLLNPAPKIGTQVLVNPAPAIPVIAPVTPKLEPQPVILPTAVITTPVNPAAVAPKIETQGPINPAIVVATQPVASATVPPKIQTLANTEAAVNKTPAVSTAIQNVVNSASIPAAAAATTINPQVKAATPVTPVTSAVVTAPLNQIVRVNTFTITPTGINLPKLDQVMVGHIPPGGGPMTTSVHPILGARAGGTPGVVAGFGNLASPDGSQPPVAMPKIVPGPDGKGGIAGRTEPGAGGKGGIAGPIADGFGALPEFAPSGDPIVGNIPAGGQTGSSSSPIVDARPGGHETVAAATPFGELVPAGEMVYASYGGTAEASSDPQGAPSFGASGSAGGGAGASNAETASASSDPQGAAGRMGSFGETSQGDFTAEAGQSAGPNNAVTQDSAPGQSDPGQQGGGTALAQPEAAGETISFRLVSGGRGVGQTADMGRSSSLSGIAPDVFSVNYHVAETPPQVIVSGQGSYFCTNAFRRNLCVPGQPSAAQLAGSTPGPLARR